MSERKTHNFNSAYWREPRAGLLDVVITAAIMGALGTFLGPALKAIGVETVKAALGAGHLAMTGQSMPPVGLTAFVVVGIVGRIINKKVDPVKVMLLALPLQLLYDIRIYCMVYLR